MCVGCVCGTGFSIPGSTPVLSTIRVSEDVIVLEFSPYDGDRIDKVSKFLIR